MMSAPLASALMISEPVMSAIWMSPLISAADATDPPPRPCKVTSRPYLAKMPLSRAKKSGRWAPPSGYETLSLVAGPVGAVAAGLAGAVAATVGCTGTAVGAIGAAVHADKARHASTRTVKLTYQPRVPRRPARR